MEQVWPAGDHFVVMGRVQHFSIERARMPLLFFQGGYGSFLSKSIVAPSSDRLRSLFKTVDVARASMETLSTQLGTGCLAISVVNDEIITLASTVRPDSHQVPAAVGQRVSWAPPLGALLVAWEGPDTVEHWLRRAKPPLNDGQRDQYLQALARVRSRGWSLALDSRAHREFEDAIAQAGDGADPDWRSGIEGLIGRLQPSYEPANLGSGTYRVRHIGAPVFDHRGKVVLGLHLFGLCDPLTVSQIEDLISAVVEAADSVTHKTGGRRPAEAAGNHVPISALSRDASDAITAQASGSPENGADA
jgi:DNA-binding IclR family transcriptional regulator